MAQRIPNKTKHEEVMTRYDIALGFKPPKPEFASGGIMSNTGEYVLTMDQQRMLHMPWDVRRFRSTDEVMMLPIEGMP